MRFSSRKQNLVLINIFESKTEFSFDLTLTLAGVIYEDRKIEFYFRFLRPCLLEMMAFSSFLEFFLLGQRHEAFDALGGNSEVLSF